MTLTKSEFDAIVARAARREPAYRVLFRVLRALIWPLAWPVTRIGAVRRAIGRTVGGRAGAIDRCRRRGEHARAAALALEALKADRHPPEQTGRPSGRPSAEHSARRSANRASHRQWWQFMAYAVASLERCDDPAGWDEAMALARDGVQPFRGYAVAYAFHAFARRKLAERDLDAATAFAMVAGQADETWGEPEFLLGRHELASGRGDGLAHLSRAVHKDPAMLARIADDPTCRRHPDLIAALKAVGDQGSGIGDQNSIGNHGSSFPRKRESR